MKYQFCSSSIEDTIKCGTVLAKSVGENSVIILLNGNLGAGKTTFVHGLARGFEISSDVNSPSFNLLNIYSGKKVTIYHIDAYRDKNISWDSLMLDDLIKEPFCCVIEWPNNFTGLPQDYPVISIDVQISSDTRLFTFSINENTVARSIEQNFKSAGLNLLQN